MALVTFAWLVARAQVQAITIDEADTFSAWAAGGPGVHWLAASNNHVLNSMLIRLSTSVFGIWHLSVRLPALLGAAIYLAGAVALCLSLQRGLSAFVLFTLLAVNPMTQDYLVAARGYGMASGFLLWALWLVLRDRGVDTAGAAGALSVCLALCFASSFAFAWVCCAVMAVGAVQLRRGSARAWSALVLPGVMLTMLLSAYTAAHMPQEQLWFGTKTLERMFGSVRDSFLSKPNVNLANPWVLAGAEFVRQWLVPALLVGLVGSVVAVAVRRQWDARVRRVVLSLVILTTTVVLHYAAYVVRGILLPMERTAIFLVPLCVVLVSSAASLEERGRAGRLWQASLRSLLALAAVYVLLCLRLTWFAEWRWNADNRRLHDAGAWWAKACGTRSVASSWHFLSGWNFYEAMTGRRVGGVRNKDKVGEEGADVWLLLADFDGPLVQRRGLTVVWRGNNGAIVAVSPGCMARQAKGSLATER